MQENWNVKKLTEYDINLVNLKDKKHEYDFELNNDFFALFEQNLVNGGQLHAHVILDKSSLLLNFEFQIKGDINLTCDRSLEEFDYPVDINQTLLVKFGDQEVELDENVLQITNDTQSINIAQHLFDYIGVSIPMKKLHPRFEVDENSEGDILIYTTGTNTDADESEDDSADPRWNILKDLNKN
ncbi:YceD family protein [Adhaeribacter aquaticus]|uniref:YceD family protein n=1 Tax=Adhaeribacter aquaticus TaxID=299567 RepID=UPI001FE021BD|nr:DUF177 domain-containing protein [Adhaeribacter aquaticus]